MNTGTITEDQAFIQLKKTLLTSKRNIEIASNTALKTVQDLGTRYKDMEKEFNARCKQDQFQNELLVDNIEIMQGLCFISPFILPPCQEYVASVRRVYESKKVVTEGITCVTAPTILFKAAVLYVNLAKISIWALNIV